MNLSVLMEQYQNSPRLFQLADKLTLSKPQHIVLKHLSGSSPEFLVTAIFKLRVSDNCIDISSISRCIVFFAHTLFRYSHFYDIQVETNSIATNESNETTIL